MPDFSTMWKRSGASMPAFERDRTFRSAPGSAIRLAVDSTGIKNSNRGEWIRVKWNVRRGFFKMHILVDVDTRCILEFCLTDMNGGDAAQLPGLMSGLLKEYAGEGATLPEPVADIVIDSAPNAAGWPDRSRTLMDRWLPGGDAGGEAAGEDPDAAEDADEDGDYNLGRIRRALEERGISMGLWGDGAYDARYV
ncbi:MAG: transposase, partial [Nitrosopumilaceae archaeon]|nr:transposase [Nitrosopumilaceae archaeon]